LNTANKSMRTLRHRGVAARLAPVIAGGLLLFGLGLLARGRSRPRWIRKAY
jgi:hypothetical protein